MSEALPGFDGEGSHSGRGAEEEVLPRLRWSKDATIERMEIALLYFEGCPHSQLANDRITSALEGLDRDDIAGPKHVLVNTPEDVDRLGFRGSPTILIDGLDPFPTDSPIGFSCRVYRTEHGTDGAPSVEQLRAAFRA